MKLKTHLLQVDLLTRLLPVRDRDTHKNQCGHVLVIGGHAGMAGAARMAAEAAARSGAGLVSVFTQAESVAVINSGRPELMCQHVWAQLPNLLNKATAIVIGPGLGQSQWSLDVWKTALQFDKPIVVDADALNILVREVNTVAFKKNWILTPHVGEAGRLLQQSPHDIQTDRVASVMKLQQRYGGVAILKGAGTLVASAINIFECPAGNPGMASGGMGDVLSGILGGLLAQGLSIIDAACAGVLIHALAGDEAAKLQGQRGLLAMDLMPYIQRWVNPNA
ncbi:MAG: hypothetical protein Tsb005_10490 [Gammaproteobacteria bacterium]